jgi:multidrug efflux pump subunit AcrA (membrane-fusion protein)
MRLPGRKKSIGIAIGVALLILLGYRFLWYRPPVAVITVDMAEIHGKVHGPGTVQSRVSVTVSTKITGILEKLHADQGDRVQKGQLLAVLDAVELKARKEAANAAKGRTERDLAKARADLIRTQANLSLAQSNYRRDLEVFKPGYISQAAFDTTKAALKIAESEVDAGQATVKALQAAVNQAESETRAADALLGYTRIYAPMDGLITVRKAETGSTVAPGTAIFQMVDLNRIWAASWIDETKISGLRLGQKATIRLRSGCMYQGEVARINREADTVTRELEVDVKFYKLPEPLVIGEETEVDIETGSQSALAVPLSAIMEQSGVKGVFVVSIGRTGFQKASLGIHDDRVTTVLSGLKKGDLVVLNPLGIKPGMRVRPEINSYGR